jgi:apolipoprotein N-acyltransferase
MNRSLTLLAALGTGLLLAASLPPWGWWPLALLGIAGLDRLIADRPRAVRFRRGLLVALALYLPSMWWMQDLTLPGYVVATVAYSALFGVAVTIVPAAAPGRWLALPGAIAVCELLRWSWPFGGVPLSNLAIAQIDGPLGPVVRVGGPLLLVQVTVIAGLILATALQRRWLASGVAVGITALLLVSAAVSPRAENVGELDVALVQGGGEQGTRVRDVDQREVFERHLHPSRNVDTPVDLVVWPENVVNVQGTVETNREGAELEALARELDAPVIVGVVEGIDSDNFANASVVYSPDGEIADRYDKVHRVPFGEYVPLRWLVEPFAGDSLTRREALIGDGPAYVDTEVGRLSIAISWEVFFSDRIREGVGNDAQLVLNPTNAASYTGTFVQTQQIAMSQMRAIESDRWVLQVAPTGLSAVIGPDGTVHQRSSVSDPALLQHTVGLRSGSTFYTTWGLLPALVVALLSLAMGWGTVMLPSRRQRTAMVDGDTPTDEYPVTFSPDQRSREMARVTAEPKVPDG